MGIFERFRQRGQRARTTALLLNASLRNEIDGGVGRCVLGLIQHVALAVVTRWSGEGREFLMVRNANYNGYFFPASRIKEDTTPEKEAVACLRRDTGLFGPIRITAVRQTEPVVQFSPRFERRRRFVFWVCRAELPEAKLEASLPRSGLLWHWFAEDQLRDDPAANDLSPTVPAVRDAVFEVG